MLNNYAYATIAFPPESTSYRELKSVLLKLGYWVFPIKDMNCFLVVCHEDGFSGNLRKLGNAYNLNVILFKDYEAMDKCFPSEAIKDMPETFYGLQNLAKASVAKESEGVLKALGIARTRTLDEYRKSFYASRTFLRYVRNN